MGNRHTPPNQQESPQQFNPQLQQGIRKGQSQLMPIKVDSNGEATNQIPEFLKELLRKDAFIANYIRVWAPTKYALAMEAYEEWKEEKDDDKEIHDKALPNIKQLPEKGSPTNDDESRGA